MAYPGLSSFAFFIKVIMGHSRRTQRPNPWALLVLFYVLGLNHSKSTTYTSISCSKSSKVCGMFEHGVSVMFAGGMANSSCCLRFYYEKNEQNMEEALCDCETAFLSTSTARCTILMASSSLFFGGEGPTFEEARLEAFQKCQVAVVPGGKCEVMATTCAEQGNPVK